MPRISTSSRAFANSSPFGFWSMVFNCMPDQVDGSRREVDVSPKVTLRRPNSCVKDYPQHKVSTAEGILILLSSIFVRRFLERFQKHVRVNVPCWGFNVTDRGINATMWGPNVTFWGELSTATVSPSQCNHVPHAIHARNRPRSRDNDNFGPGRPYWFKRLAHVGTARRPGASSDNPRLTRSPASRVDIIKIALQASARFNRIAAIWSGISALLSAATTPSALGVEAVISSSPRGKPHRAEDCLAMAPLHPHGRNRARPRLDDAARLCSVMALPIIPHEEFGADCCGCLVEVVGDTTEYRCNECGAIIPPEDVQRIVMEMESVEVSCPHCGKVNHIEGFSEVYAFVCRYCGHSTARNQPDHPGIIPPCPSSE